jgi:CHAT domain-containing protein
MSKDLKLALIVAPFLAIVGFVAIELWLLSTAKQTKVVVLATQGECDITGQGCLLQSGDLQLKITDNAGMTQLNSTYPLDKVTLFLVDNNQLMTPYPLTMHKNRYYWQTATPLRTLLTYNTTYYSLRLIVAVGDGQYISEFITRVSTKTGKN